MNKSLQNLKDQAQFAGNRYASMDEFADEFAELIVLDCSKWIVDNAEIMDQIGPEFFGLALCKHFGIK